VKFEKVGAHTEQLKQKMRTKTIILGAAIIAAGALSSMAQSNVFSLNTVGYYNVQLTNGFTLMANQLDLDGTGTNNTLPSVFGTNLPNLTKVLAFTPAGTFVSSTYIAASHSFTGATNTVKAGLQPGYGVFVQLPAGPVPTLTIVGNVLGTNGVTNTFATGYGTGLTILSSKVPVAGGVSTNLGFVPAANLDTAQQFNSASQSYFAKHSWLSASSSWTGGQPSLRVGEAFFFSAHVAGNWTQNFIIQ